uniref:tyrosine-type recombinase/integrase n=1 Tax=Lachnospira sp. TaxID=2049031 RepID=UPI003FF13105
MSTSQPIRSTDELEAFRRFYLDEEPNLRNYAMICMGVNTALRISDLLELKWGEVYDFNERCFRKHMVICERKTGKESRIAINGSTKKGLLTYMDTLD